MIQENGQSLAYIGDAIYELRVREYLLSKGYGLVKKLHNEAIKYTNALSQSKIIDHLMDKLTEEEIDYYKRGRNASSTHKPKNASLNDYRKATGFESLIGYLYLIKNFDRMDELINLSIDFINSENAQV